MGWQNNDKNGADDVLDLGFNTDDITPEERSFEIIPKSWQPVVITGAQVEKSKSSDARYVKATATVVDGQFKGRKVFSNITILNKDGTPNTIGRGQITEMFRAAGVGGSNLADLLQAKKVIDARIGIEKGAGGYEDKNKLDGFRPHGAAQAAPSAAPASRPASSTASSSARPASSGAPAFLQRKQG